MTTPQVIALFILVLSLFSALITYWAICMERKRMAGYQDKLAFDLQEIRIQTLKRELQKKEKPRHENGQFKARVK